jgi:divalent metal cation (Fe/Co/Zn/Cd) transporter
VFRYIRIYNAVEQQQTKWFVFALSIAFVLVIIQEIFQILATESTVATIGNQLVNGPFWLVLWTLVFVGVSIPVLRYRLWDIDVIINRTLVYGSLTVLLGALYAGLILGLQGLAGLFGLGVGDNPVALVISTLVIAVLVRPLRSRIQSLIDSRFYRKKYDAAKTVAAFGATLGQDTNLEQIQEQLLAVVNETMQPTHVSLQLLVRRPDSEFGDNKPVAP